MKQIQILMRVPKLSDSGEIEEPESVPKVKKGKWKIAQETDVKEHVQKQHKRNVDSNHKSDEKTSEEKSDDNSKSDLENITKTSKQTDSVQTVKPFAQGAMPMHVQGQGQQSLLGLKSYSNVMPGVEAVQLQMMSPYGMQPLAAAGYSGATMQINVRDFQSLMNFVW